MERFLMRSYTQWITFFLFLILSVMTASVMTTSVMTAVAQERRGALSGLYGDMDFGVPAVRGEKSYTVSAKIVADSQKTADGYLVVQIRLQPGWYIYSNTQPKGGPLPTQLEVDPHDAFLAGPFTASMKPKSEKNDLFGIIIESHVGNIAWVAPIRLAGKIPLENLVITGKLNGQVCEADTCVPITEPFRAAFDPVGASAEIEGAREVAAALEILRPQAVVVPDKSDTKTALNLDHLEGDEVVKVHGIGIALLYAFLGGIILNVMPCVLPVIGLKIVSFFEQAGKNRVRAFILNVWYSFGLLTVFAVLAVLSVGLSTMFTYSVFGIVMGCIVFAMALSLMEVWELRAPVFLGTGKSEEMMRQEGFFGAYFKGIITTLLAIPCGAPLLSPALAWADVQVKNNAQANVLIAYLVIGLGMATPFLIIGAFPELIRFLPKPGPWMETFKKTMGFVLLFAVVWILYFIPLESIVPTVALIFAVWFGCWFIGRLPITASTDKRLTVWGVSLLVFFVVLVFSFPVIPNNPYTLQTAMEAKLARLTGKDTKHWSNFSMERLESDLAAGKNVIVDFTADWCLSCKELENRVLHNREVLAKIDELNITTLQADWTNRDPVITSLLRKLGGEQVPVIAVFRADSPNKPLIFRGWLTVDVFLGHLNEL